MRLEAIGAKNQKHLGFGKLAVGGIDGGLSGDAQAVLADIAGDADDLVRIVPAALR